jgi:Spy/CpxP family protein refolding chaperone
MVSFRLGSFVLATSLALASSVAAQDTPPTPPPPPGGEQAPDGEGRRRDRGGRGGMGLPVERMTEELGLTPEQITQLEALNQEMRDKGRTMMREMFQGGGGDPSAMRERMKTLFEETFTKLDGFLTPEQKEKAKGLRTQLEERMQRGGMRGERGERGGFGGRGNARVRLREDALKALALTEEEAAVVTPLLDTCLETRELLMTEGETRRQAFLQKARETTEPEALGKLLEEFRASREADKGTVKATMDQLREVLTVEQEAKLVGLGILD